MQYANSFLDKLVQDFVEWATGVEACRSIVLYGSASRSIHPADQYADRDILVYVRDTDSEQYLDWMRQYAPVWLVVEERHKLWLIVYKGGHIVHLGLDPLERLRELVDTQQIWFQRSYKILLDKDDIAAKLPPAEIPIAERPPETDFEQCIQAFFYGAILIAKQIKRGDLWKVKRAMGVQQGFMLQMLEWHAQTLYGVDTWDRGAFMQEWVSEETWRALHEIFAHFDAQDSWRALFALMALFRKLAYETSSQLKYALPETVIAEVVSYLEMLYSNET